jgi:hypothetical protein
LVLSRPARPKIDGQKGEAFIGKGDEKMNRTKWRK